MVYNVIVPLCAIMLIGKSLGCDDRVKCAFWTYGSEFCEKSRFETNYRTWYDSEAFLTVNNGFLTVELLSDNSTPKSLNADERGISELRKNFAKIPSLKWLSLGENFIEKIDGFVFAGLPRLTYLNLERNRIKNISTDSFAGLNKLETLILRHNSLKSLSNSINDDALPKLTRLYLQHNLLDLNYGTNNNQKKFQLCHRNLKELYLSNNFIRSFDPNSWNPEQCLNSLTQLYLDKNKIFDFIIGDMPLEALSLNENDLSYIPAINFHLKFLSLSKNHIKYLRNFTNDNKSILRLVLSHNDIATSLIYAKFQALSSLEHLALDNNCLKSIPDGIFTNLTSLQSLDLTGNSICDVAPRAFSHLPSLRTLYFGHNKLSSFPGRESFGQSNLQYLDFSNNKVQKISNIQARFIPELKYLKVTGNPIKRIDPNAVSNDPNFVLISD